MRNVGEARSLVDDSDLSCRGFRGGECRKGRGGDGIMSVCIGHNGLVKCEVRLKMWW